MSASKVSLELNPVSAQLQELELSFAHMSGASIEPAKLTFPALRKLVLRQCDASLSQLVSASWLNAVKTPRLSSLALYNVWSRFERVEAFRNWLPGDLCTRLNSLTLAFDRLFCVNDFSPSETFLPWLYNLENAKKLRRLSLRNADIIIPETARGTWRLAPSLQELCLNLCAIRSPVIFENIARLKHLTLCGCYGTFGGAPSVSALLANLHSLTIDTPGLECLPELPVLKKLHILCIKQATGFLKGATLKGLLAKAPHLKQLQVLAVQVDTTVIAEIAACVKKRGPRLEAVV